MTEKNITRTLKKIMVYSSCIAAGLLLDPDFSDQIPSFPEKTRFIRNERPAQSESESKRKNKIELEFGYFTFKGIYTKYNIAKIPKEQIVNGGLELTIKQSSIGLKPFEYFAEGAELAINGSMFRKDNKMPLGLVISEDTLNYDRIKLPSKGYFINSEMDFSITDRIMSGKKYNIILESFPLLINEYRPTEIYRSEPSARSVVALDSIDNVYFITTSNGYWKGATLEGLQKFLLHKKFKSALNLDGGSSTFMMAETDSGTLYEYGQKSIKNALVVKSVNK